MPSAIRLEQVTKRYRAGRSRTIIDLIASNLDRVRGKAQDVHSVTRGKIDATIWAMRDVSFEVPEGAGLGVIGRNGAGKTTLLKLISRVTWPTSGRVRVAGRVVSLIELGSFVFVALMKLGRAGAGGFSPHRGSSALSAVALFLGAKSQRSGRRPVEPGEQPQQRALAAAAFADDG